MAEDTEVDAFGIPIRKQPTQGADLDEFGILKKKYSKTNQFINSISNAWHWFCNQF